MFSAGTNVDDDISVVPDISTIIRTLDRNFPYQTLKIRNVSLVVKLRFVKICN
jgi:hypothetical protein